MIVLESTLHVNPAGLLLLLLCAGAVIGCAVAGGHKEVPSIHLTAVPASLNLSQHMLVTGESYASISGARNETESFQIVISSSGGNLRRIDTEMSELRSRDGNVLPAESVEIFCNTFVPVRIPDPRSDLPPGMWADALVPRMNPYDGTPVQGPKWGNAGFTGERFRGRHFDIWHGQQQPMWIDVSIPKDATAGIYTGTFSVYAENAEAAHIPVQVEVWDFTLPDGPTLENHFGGFERIAAYYGVEVDSDQYHLLEDRFIEMMAGHRINPPLPRRLRPAVADDGSALFSDDLDRQICEYVARLNITNIEVPRAPFRDMLGEDRDRATAYYQSWYAYLKRKGWAERTYLYMHDETLRKEHYERVRELGAFVGEAEPELRRLTVTQPYPRNPEWGTLDGYLDIWCPLFGYIDETSVNRVLAAGDDVWTYTALVQSVPEFHPDYENVKEPDGPHWAADRAGRPPYWEMDFPLLGYRIAPWLNYRYGATGLLYWSTVFWGKKPQNPWDNPTYGDHWNGEGFLFYPGADAGVEGPVASARLKNLRDGMEDYEYFVLLAERGGIKLAEQIARDAVPTWGSWCQDARRLGELRRQMAEAIVRLGR